MIMSLLFYVSKGLQNVIQSQSKYDFVPVFSRSGAGNRVQKISDFSLILTRQPASEMVKFFKTSQFTIILNHKIQFEVSVLLDIISSKVVI